MKRLLPWTEDRIYRRIAWAAGLVFIDLRRQYISWGILRKLPARLARSRRWVPMVVNPRRVVLIVDDPAAAFTCDRAEIARCFGPPWGRQLGFALAAPSAMERFLEEKFPLE